MLNVWCVCVGDKYGDREVLVLRDMVARHLNKRHMFFCLTDRKIGGVNCVIRDDLWPGWWAKLNLFQEATGPTLYLDLDVVIVGNLDRLLSDELSLPANWAQSGHGGCQSSVMAWDGNYSFIAKAFAPSMLGEPVNGNFGHYGPKMLWGDQEFITDLVGTPGHGVKPMPHVYSYKYHCRNGVPADASVVCFHGKPKPTEVGDDWVVQSYTATAA